MISTNGQDTIGVLLSGGLDSAVLVGHLLNERHRVQPFYIRSQLVWEHGELSAVERFLRAMACSRLNALVTLDLPLADLYRDHWSITGSGTPGAHTDDDAVFLPGRNALLVIKAALWCQMNDIRVLAMAPLGTSPFADARDDFFESLQMTLNRAGQPALQIVRPFSGMNKQQVMQLGRDMPLDLTFSCIAPRHNLHCGQCNKCGERQAAFRQAGRHDPTRYFTNGKSPVTNI